MRVEIVDATLAHAEFIAANMRSADVKEIWACSMSEPLPALLHGLKHSMPALTALVDGVPVAMFGVVPISLVSGFGVPWLLGTSDLIRYQRLFVRHSRPVLARLRSIYRFLTNWCDDRNTAAHRWLTWLEFHVEPATPYGVHGLPFRRFTWRRDDDV